MVAVGSEMSEVGGQLIQRAVRRMNSPRPSITRSSLAHTDSTLWPSSLAPAPDTAKHS